MLAYLWPVIGRATVVAKKELLYAFPFGLAAYLWGTLYIDRSNKTDALHKLGQESRAIRDNAAKLLFFPEGTRHQGDALLPFKKGAFHIAVQSGSAIQPVVVSRYWFLNSKRKIFGRGKMYSLISAINPSDKMKFYSKHFTINVKNISVHIIFASCRTLRHSNFARNLM